MKRIRIFFEYLAAFLIIFLLLFAIASAVVVKYYGDEVKEYTMKLINEQVDTKIYVKEMGISVFRKFPYTSLFFNDVTVWSGHGFNRSEFPGVSVDTLFTAETVFLQFNIIDLARRRYTIRSLEARNGVIRAFSDKAGAGNYTISKEDSEETTNSFLLDLKGVNIKDYRVKYINRAKSIDSEVDVSNVQLEGNFSKVNYQLKASCDAYIHTLNTHDIQYISDQSFHSNVSIQVKERVYTISKGEIGLGELVSDITGEFLLSPEGTADLNLNITGRKLDIAWILDILKKNGLESVSKITGSGSIDLNASITGISSSKLTPHIHTKFSTQGAMVRIEDSKFALKSMDLEGDYDNGLYNSGSSSKLEITSFRAEMADSDISGSLAVQNFLLPRFTLTLKGRLALQDVITLYDKIPISNASGFIVPDLEVNGMITGLGKGKPGLSFIPHGTVSINESSFRLKDEKIEFSSMEGNIDIGNTIWKTTLSGNAGVSDFALTATSSNPLNFFINNDRLDINASVSSRVANFDDLLKGIKKHPETKQSFQYPENIGARVAFRFEDLKKDKIRAEKVSGIAHYSFPSVFVDSLVASTMSGSISGKAGLYNINQFPTLVVASSSIENVNITSLFESFNNFSQDFITADNLKGKISGNIDFSAPFGENFKIENSKITLNSDIRIEEGELNHFQPMVEMSKFLKIDKMDHIVFSTLENKIMIKDNAITIPEMDIQSTALNLAASGVHSFDNTFRYHLSIKLSELLFRKAQSSARKEFEVALDERDKRTIFLLLYDEGAGIVIEFDEDQAIKKIKSDLRQERSELKSVLNEEFGLFENHPDVIENIQKQESPMFKFEFPDDEPADTLKTDASETTRWRRNKKENKKGVDFVIEHDLIP